MVGYGVVGYPLNRRFDDALVVFEPIRLNGARTPSCRAAGDQEPGGERGGCETFVAEEPSQRS